LNRMQRLPNLLARLAQLHQQIDSGQQAAIWRECGVLACTRRSTNGKSSTRRVVS